MTRDINLPLLSFIGSRSWAISSQGLTALASHAKSQLSLELTDFFEIRPSSYVTKNGTGVITIHGATVDSCAPIYEKLGIVTKYSTIRREISEMKGGVKRFLFVFDSPGGTVSGLREMAEDIAALEVPTLAYCKFACSAAYYSAVSCDYVIASPSAVVGNIGTILAWADVDGYWEQIGVIFKALTNEGADLKSTFHLEPDDAQLSFLQERVNQMGNEFREQVRSNRPDIDDEVFRAGWYSGEQAGELGLIDGMDSFERTLELFETL